MEKILFLVGPEDWTPDTWDPEESDPDDWRDPCDDTILVGW